MRNFYYRICILCLGLGFVTSSYCQHADSTSHRRFTLCTSIVEYIPTLVLSTGNFNIGAEFGFTEKSSFEINVGYIKSYRTDQTYHEGNLGLMAIPNLGTQGWKLQLEKKYFLRPDNRRVHKESDYFSVHLTGQTTQTKRAENISTQSSQGAMVTVKSNYLVERNVIKLNFKYGLQLIKESGFTADVSVGLGAQYISSASPNRVFVNNQIDIPWNKKFDEGSGVFPNFVFQFKLGWSWP